MTTSKNQVKARILKVGIFTDEEFSGWEFDCEGCDFPVNDLGDDCSLVRVAGYTLGELKIIAEKASLPEDHDPSQC